MRNTRKPKSTPKGKPKVKPKAKAAPKRATKPKRKAVYTAEEVVAAIAEIDAENERMYAEIEAKRARRERYEALCLLEDTHYDEDSKLAEAEWDAVRARVVAKLIHRGLMDEFDNNTMLAWVRMHFPEWFTRYRYTSVEQLNTDQLRMCLKVIESQYVEWPSWTFWAETL